MRLLVVKFGGTSVRYGYNKIINIIHKLRDEYDKIIIVISALSQVTNMLLDGLYKAKENTSFSNIISNIFNAHLELLLTNDKKADIQKYLTEYLQICNTVHILKEITPKIEAKILSYGELMSLITMNDIFIANNIKHTLVYSTEYIHTDSTYLDALVDIKKTTEDMHNKLNIHNSDQIILTNGFLSKDINGDITTLGRGGSDYTATLIGSILNASEVHIYSDVDGIMSGDPKKITNAQILDHIYIKEAAELSFFGAKILHPKTVQPLMNSNIELKVLNTFNSEEKGTIISNINQNKHKKIIAVTSISNVALITIEGNGILGRVGIASRIFETVSKLNINIPFITQASSETSICFAITDIHSTIVIDAISNKLKNEIECNYVQNINKLTDVSLITIVGANMIKCPGIAGKIFSLLGDNNINIIAISQGSSEISITIVVHQSEETKTLNIIHELIL